MLPTINSFIRFLHVSPGTPNVDIYWNEELLVKDLSYNNISEYVPTGPETKRIQIFAAGENENPLLDTEINILPSERITYAIIGTLPEIRLLPILLSVEPIENPEVLMRFAHLSPNTPNLDVILTEEDNLFSNVEYTEITDYKTILPDSYNIKLKLTNEEEIIFTSETLEFKNGNAYTVYALGLLGENPPLDINYYQDQIPFLSTDLNKEAWKTEKVVAPSNNSSPKIIFTYY